MQSQTLALNVPILRKYFSFWVIQTQVVYILVRDHQWIYWNVSLPLNILLHYHQRQLWLTFTFSHTPIQFYHFIIICDAKLDDLRMIRLNFIKQRTHLLLALFLLPISIISLEYDNVVIMLATIANCNIYCG